MATIGYVRPLRRCSVEVQEGALREVGCDRIFRDDDAGQQFPELNSALNSVGPDDILAVARLSTLAGTLAGLQSIAIQVTAKGARILVAHGEKGRLSIASGSEAVALLNALTEFEADQRAERQKDGIEAAKARGVYRGRKPSVDAEEIRRALASGERPIDVARRLNVARSTVYRLAD